jgi:hypothetical protein
MVVWNGVAGKSLFYRMYSVGYWVMCPDWYDMLLAKQFGDNVSRDGMM